MARFSLLTGLRESNVTKLEWNQIDLQRQVAWIHPDQAKAGKGMIDSAAIFAKDFSGHPA
jgi:integrase